MGPFLAGLGSVGVWVFGIWLIVNAVRKKGKKKLLGALIGASIIVMLMSAAVSTNEPKATIPPGSRPVEHATAAPTPPSTPLPPQTPPPALTVTAQVLYSTYKDNAIAGDRQFKGKIVYVDGIIDKVGKDILGTPYVLLTDGSEYAISGVQCLFDSSQLNALANLRKGQRVIIMGSVDSYLLNVLVKDSFLVDVK